MLPCPFQFLVLIMHGVFRNTGHAPVFLRGIREFSGIVVRFPGFFFSMPVCHRIVHTPLFIATHRIASINSHSSFLLLQLFFFLLRFPFSRKTGGASALPETIAMRIFQVALT